MLQQRSFEILGLKVCNYNYTELLNFIKYNISENIKIRGYYANTFTLLMAKDNPNFRDILNSGLIIRDGIGVHLACKYLYGWRSLNEKTVSTELWNKILLMASRNNFSVCFWGGEKGYEERLRKKILKEYPGIKLVDIFNGYDEIDFYKLFKNKNSDVLMLGLGSPLQEKMSIEIDKLNVFKLILCVGSAIDYFSGAKKRAPLILRKANLEWIYRFITEFKRLKKRYTFDLARFILEVIKQKQNS